MEVKKGFFEKYQNPALWITILASFWWFSQEIGMIRSNENNHKVLERRVENKTVIQEEHSDRLYEIEIEHLKDQIKFEKEKLEMVKAHHALELKVLENKIRLEYLNDKR